MRFSTDTAVMGNRDVLTIFSRAGTDPSRRFIAYSGIYTIDLLGMAQAVTQKLL